MQAPEPTESGLSRRSMLKRGALVGGAALWTVPIIQVVTMSPAAADNPSAPTSGSNNGNQDDNPGQHLGNGNGNGGVGNGNGNGNGKH